MIRDVFNQTRLLLALSNLDLNVSRNGASTTSLRNLGQDFTTLTVKNFFLLSSLNLPSYILKLIPLVLLQQALLNVCPHLSPKPTLIAVKIFLEFSLVLFEFKCRHYSEVELKKSSCYMNGGFPQICFTFL